MKKILFLGLLFVGLLIVVGCVPPENTGEKTAMAGLAISNGCYDADNDGFGMSGRSIAACSGSKKVFDCNDNNAQVSPRAAEICGNSIDDNCNGRVDEPRGCVTPITPPPASNVQGAAAPVTVTTAGNQVTVAVGGSPVVQLDATTNTNLGAVGIQISGSRVVVTNAVGISHRIYVRNTGNQGVYVCPSAQTLAAVSPTCSGVLSYTDAQCRDTTFTACQYDAVSNSYVVSVTGSGADERAPPLFCYYLDRNGARMPAGTKSGDAVTAGYSGIETEAGIFGPICSQLNRVGYTCGTNIANSYSSAFDTSGSGVPRSPSTVYLSYCSYGCNAGSCCDQSNSQLSCGADGNVQVTCGQTTTRFTSCSSGCNTATNACCQVISVEEHCEGNIAVNSTTTDCSVTPNIQRQDCSTFSSFLNNRPKVCTTYATNRVYCSDSCTPAESIITCGYFGNNNAWYQQYTCDSSGLRWNNVPLQSCPSGQTCLASGRCG